MRMGSEGIDAFVSNLSDYLSVKNVPAWLISHALSETLQESSKNDGVLVDEFVDELKLVSINDARYMGDDMCDEMFAFGYADKV